MHITIERNSGQGWVWRSLRLMKGRRDKYAWMRTIAFITLNITRRREGDRAYLKCGRFFWCLPSLRLWSRLYDRWSA